MLTLEFAAKLTPDQSHRAQAWLQASKLVYNRALAELEAWDEAYGWNIPKTQSEQRNEKGQPVSYYAACCQLPWRYRWDAELGRPIAYTPLVSDRSWWLIRDLPRLKVPQASEQKQSWGWEQGIGYSCPINVDFHQPLLKRWERAAAGGLGQVVKNDYWYNEQVLDIPSKFRHGILTMLETPWQEYLKSRMGVVTGPKRGKPRKKRQRDAITTLIHPNPKGVVRPDGDSLKGVPGMAKKGQSVVVPGLSRRWRNPDGEIPQIATFKLLLLPDGCWRIQLTGDLKRSFPVKPSRQAIGIDPGCIYQISTSDGEQVLSSRIGRNSEQHVAALQQQLAHKLDMALIFWLAAPERTVADLQSLCTIAAQKAETILGAKSIDAILDIVTARQMQQLRHGIPKSRRLQLLELQLNKRQRAIGKRRKAEDDKLTSRLIREHGAIAIEDGLQSQNLKKRAAPKPAEQGGYERNNRAAKSGLAKSLTDSTPGRKIAMLDRKAKRSNRDFKKISAPYTSTYCPVCTPHKGAQDWVKAKYFKSNLDGDRMYRCDCGWQCDRDLNSGVNIELIAFGDRLDLQLSAHAEEARRTAIQYSEGQAKSWRPHWAKQKKSWDTLKAHGLNDQN